MTPSELAPDISGIRGFIQKLIESRKLSIAVDSKTQFEEFSRETH
jgi:hypothetical protein